MLERLVNKFKNAFDGIFIAFKIDSGVRIQFVLASITVLISLFLNLTTTEWLIIIVCIGGVLTAEMINTAIEKSLDYISDENSMMIKRIKDISAGAVLLVSMTSFIIMLLIMLSKGELI